MTEIRVNQAYIAKAVKTGRSKQGPYEIIIVQAPGRGQPKIAISVLHPPSGIGANGVFKLTYIKSVMHRKYKKGNGQWSEGGVTVKGNVKPLAQLKPGEVEHTKKINYEEVETVFPSIEDYFS